MIDVEDLIDEVDNLFFFLSGRPEGGGMLLFTGTGREGGSAGKFGSLDKSITSSVAMDDAAFSTFF